MDEDDVCVARGPEGRFYVSEVRHGGYLLCKLQN